MKEFVDKLIKRFEEKAKRNEQRAIKTDESDRISLITALQAMADRYRDAIQIAKELEEEYNNDFCEWKLEEDNGIVWHCSDECSTYNNSYIKNLRIVLEDFEVICPHCGKKIKVVE